MHRTLQHNLQTAIDLKQQILNDRALSEQITQITELIVHCFQNKKKVLFCGNGGSAADAQHLSAEFSGRYYYDRPPLFSEALHVNTSYVTAVANDYSYNEIYARLAKAMIVEGDILIGLSTSGNSGNIIEALKVANDQGGITIGFTGKTGGNMKAVCQHTLQIPSTDTPRIQECHMLIGHTICEVVEQTLFPKP